MPQHHTTCQRPRLRGVVLCGEECPLARQDGPALVVAPRFAGQTGGWLVYPRAENAGAPWAAPTAPMTARRPPRSPCPPSPGAPPGLPRGGQGTLPYLAQVGGMEFCTSLVSRHRGGHTRDAGVQSTVDSRAATRPSNHNHEATVLKVKRNDRRPSELGHARASHA